MRSFIYRVAAGLAIVKHNVGEGAAQKLTAAEAATIERRARRQLERSPRARPMSLERLIHMSRQRRRARQTHPGKRGKK